MILKNGIKLEGLQPEILMGAIVAGHIWANHNRVLVVTEGYRKSDTSLHGRDGKCRAVDLRTHYFDDEEKQVVAAELRDALTDEFDVVVEDTHIHLEYDP